MMIFGTQATIGKLYSYILYITIIIVLVLSATEMKSGINYLSYSYMQP